MYTYMYTLLHIYYTYMYTYMYTYCTYTHTRIHTPGLMLKPPHSKTSPPPPSPITPSPLTPTTPPSSWTHPPECFCGYRPATGKGRKNIRKQSLRLQRYSPTCHLSVCPSVHLLSVYPSVHCLTVRLCTLCLPTIYDIPLSYVCVSLYCLSSYLSLWQSVSLYIPLLALFLSVFDITPLHS